jgi:hypothetical protein
MSDESTSEPERTQRSAGLFSTTTPAWRATDPEPIRPESADRPSPPAAEPQPAAGPLLEGESSYPWPSWRPDEEFGQGDEGFGGDV